MGEKKSPASALSKSKAGRRIAEAGHPVDGERDGYCSLYASLLKQS